LPRKEWLKLQSVAHATTRITALSADLIRQVIPNATAKTPIVGKWSYDAEKKLLTLEIKEGTA
jgi:hypothetical protein